MSLYDPAIKPLQNGAVGLLPSDTIYGISCQALNKEAVNKIHGLKDRSSDKPFIILISDTKQAEMLGLDKKDLEPASKYWPAPLTVIIPAGSNTPAYLHRGTSSLALRIPDNKDLRKLIAQVGPIISTSANPQDQPPATSAKQAMQYFGDSLDFYIDAEELKSQPSTIIQIKDSNLKIIRQGALVI